MKGKKNQEKFLHLSSKVEKSKALQKITFKKLKKAVIETKKKLKSILILYLESKKKKITVVVFLANEYVLLFSLHFHQGEI